MPDGTCKHCGKTRWIYGRGLCQSCWKRHRDAYPLLCAAKKIWTRKEVLWLAGNYRSLGPKGCASHLKRTKGSVVMQAVTQGLCKERHPTTEIEADLRRLHGEGLSDGQIARRWGEPWSRDKVKYHRHQLGLPANPFRRVQQAEGRRSYKRVCHLHDTDSLVDVRWDVEMEDVHRTRGWPLVRSHRQADVLDLLAKGPHTAAEMLPVLYSAVSTGRYNALRKMLARLVRIKLVVKRRIVTHIASGDAATGAPAPSSGRCSAPAEHRRRPGAHIEYSLREGVVRETNH
jgi:hypothetical protein